jgi:uncharacterized protein
MGKSITVKAETIEEAVRLALSITELDIENVNIEADEEIEFYNDVDPQRIVDRLKAMGIQKRLTLMN